MIPVKEAEAYRLVKVSYAVGQDSMGVGESLSPKPRSEELPLGGSWVTPGLYLARHVQTRAEVVQVTEKIEPARHCVAVLVDRDPEDLMDRIFEVEHQMYSVFTKLPFDVRVVLQQPGMEPELMARDSLVHYKRA